MPPERRSAPRAPNATPPMLAAQTPFAGQGRVVRPPPPILDPLTSAYQHHQEAAEKRDLKRETRALIEENTQLKAQLAEVIKMRQAPSVIVYDKSVEERCDAIACALASDWHVEEPVVAGSVNGLNEYSLEIAKIRAQWFFKNLLKLTDIMAHETKITTIFIALLGDFFSGFIHEELMGGNELAPGDAAKFVSDLWFAGIDFLLKESSYKIVGDCIPGNHGRMTHKMWISNPTGTSLETFMYHNIANRYHDNPRVELNVSDHAMVYRDFFEAFKLRLLHGWECKYGGGVGGLTIPLKKALHAWNNGIKADLTVLGHFHQFLDIGDAIVNGSLIGYNAFAQTIRANFEPPRQAFFTVHARHGGEKSIVAPIYLEAVNAGIV